LLATAIFAFKLILRREIFDTSRVPGYFLGRFIKKNDIDILWSVEPLGYPLDMPYVTVHWDLGHRMLPIFPEFSVKNSEWKRRDRRESRVLQQATIVCVGTQQGFQEIHSAYGIEQRNCIIVPLPVQHDGEVRVEKRDPKLFLYPAQFWPHKNHITLLRAFARASSELEEEIRLVLPGLDKGNRQLAIEQAKTLSIQDFVEFPGFISKDELIGLYRRARLLLFPSYLGPDNLPPLEAMAYSCPVAVADIPGAREQYGDAAIYFSPISVDEICKVILNEARSSNTDTNEVRQGLELVKKRTPEDYVDSVLAAILNLDSYLCNFRK
jgi:glycosyltransferase involved in cell wall biosynthesis